MLSVLEYAGQGCSMLQPPERWYHGELMIVIMTENVQTSANAFALFLLTA